MPLIAHVPIEPARRAELDAWLAGQRTTEDIVRAVLDAGLSIDDVVWMDEFTLDLLVPLPDGLVLVYDTT